LKSVADISYVVPEGFGDLGEMSDKEVSEFLNTQRIASGVVRRFTAKSFNLNVGDPVFYGKYKNKAGVIVGFDKDDKGNPLVLVDPVPKGRKQTKAIQLFRIWYADTSKDDV